jgi:hypothetical protein
MRLHLNHITWREIDGDLVILDLRSSTYLTANASATALMRELAEDRTLQQLIDFLAQAFDLPEQRAQEDVRAFLEELSQRGLLDSGRERRRDPVAASGGR